MAPEMLADLLGDWNTFRTDYWQSRPLLRRGAGRSDLAPSLADLQSLITSGYTRRPFLRLVRDGVEIEPARYTHSHIVNGMKLSGFPDSRAIGKFFDDGSSLVLDAVHIAEPKTRRIVTELQEAFGHVPQANVYITPASSQGLTAHYDRDDVFVVQCHGSKQWEIYEPVLHQPLTGDLMQAEPRPELHLSTVLNQGDVLYIPRGWPHAATACDGTSAHVSLGLLVTTMSDVLHSLAIQLAAEVPALRQEFPLSMVDGLAVERGVRAALKDMDSAVTLAAIASVQERLLEHARRSCEEPVAIWADQ